LPWIVGGFLLIGVSSAFAEAIVNSTDEIESDDFVLNGESDPETADDDDEPADDEIVPAQGGGGNNVQ